MRALTVLIAAGALLGFAPTASATVHIILHEDTITMTSGEAQNDYVELWIEEKNTPSPNDDELFVLNQEFTGGCPVTPSSPYKLARCPLKSATKLRTTLNVTLGGTAVDRFVADLDWDGADMTANLSGNQYLNFVDASKTERNGDLNYTYVGTDSDSGTPPGSGMEVKGGAGDDSLMGPFQAHVTGGPGDDALIGLKGGNILEGGPGDDSIDPGGGNQDVVDGGEGTQDTLSFGSEKGNMTVSLDGVDNDGKPGYVVRIAGIENVSGGQGNDVITGDPGFNHLYGFRGNDQIDGGGGSHDVLRGNTGDDTVIGRNTPSVFSDVACGGGVDTAITDPLDVVASDCETVDRSAPGPGDPGGPAAPGGAGGVADDGASPGIAFSGFAARINRRDLVRRGARITIETSEPAELEAELRGTARRAGLAALRDNVIVARARAGMGSGRRTLRLRPTRALLGRARRLRLYVTATDAAGNRRTVRRAIRVR